MIKDIIEKSKKIVIKIGSNTLSGEDGLVNDEVLDNLGREISGLIRNGKEIVIVSSGARIAGVAAINKWMRKEDLNYKQALCAIGQVELMNAYKRVFNKADLTIAQMLLTNDDFEFENRTLNIRNTLFTLLDENVIPIINENDTVCTTEISIGDNDSLAALTARLWNADLLLMLSDIDGVYTKNPKDNNDAELIKTVEDVDELEKNIETGNKSDFGTGGIQTKIKAAKTVNDYGIPMILTNGKQKDIITSLLNDDGKATLFMKR